MILDRAPKLVSCPQYFNSWTMLPQAHKWLQSPGQALTTPHCMINNNNNNNNVVSDESLKRRREFVLRKRKRWRRRRRRRYDKSTRRQSCRSHNLQY